MLIFNDSSAACPKIPHCPITVIFQKNWCMNSTCFPPIHKQHPKTLFKRSTKLCFKK
jgi:hypothetical protein